MKMRKTYAAAAAIAAVVGYVGTTEAAAVYSKRSLRGVYGFSGSGTLAGGTVQAAVVGLNSFDGKGGCDITARLNAGGAEVVPLTTAECSYTVNPQGSGALTVTFNEPPFGPFTSDFVFVHGADELHFVLSNPALFAVANGVSKRQASLARN
jgi:hypothetical protein